jgi:hypothetical protein
MGKYSSRPGLHEARREILPFCIERIPGPGWHVATLSRGRVGRVSLVTVLHAPASMREGRIAMSRLLYFSTRVLRLGSKSMDISRRCSGPVADKLLKGHCRRRLPDIMVAWRVWNSVLVCPFNLQVRISSDAVSISLATTIVHAPYCLESWPRLPERGRAQPSRTLMPSSLLLLIQYNATAYLHVEAQHLRPYSCIARTQPRLVIRRFHTTAAAIHKRSTRPA